jgi:curli production assembly/transport component CsgG
MPGYSRRGSGITPALLACSLAMTGCVHDPVPSPTPNIVAEEEISLPPPPPRPLTIGIYNCIDTTGQRRPTTQPQELSTAVPLDCTPYLIEATRSLRPGWVFLVERQHLDELLRERQLATLALNEAARAAAAAAGQPASGPVATTTGPTARRPISRAAAKAAAVAAAGQPAATPPAASPNRLSMVRVAEILLLGQVTAYDRATREITGGLALGGTGGDGTLVTDLVTFSLRAVAVQTGEVLGQTSVTKSVTSLKADVHKTKILSTTILDVEFGGAGNEPVGLALRAAIRTAVGQLINKGIEDGWWRGLKP